ncbi:MAG: 2,3-diketo-L-gulonate transporter small permease protein YiaM [Pseudomonadota bacterium]|jgi:TRAP-type C4-dicarboxylate transport system permease small subunit
MTTFTQALFRLAEGLLVLLLTAMVVMVFGNVVLRYGFNTGIDFSEELSRFAFIWITFLGAIIALRENAHLGLDTLIRVLPRAGRMGCFALSNLMMLGCCGLMFYGTWRQHGIHATTLSPVTELPMIWVYGVGYVASLAMGGLIFGNLVRLVRGDITDADLIQVQDAEEGHTPASPAITAGAAR